MYSLTGRKDALKCIPQQGLMFRLRKYIGVAIFYRGTKSLNAKYAKQNAKRARQNAKNALAKCGLQSKIQRCTTKIVFPGGSLGVPSGLRCPSEKLGIALCSVRCFEFVSLSVCQFVSLSVCQFVSLLVCAES